MMLPREWLSIGEWLSIMQVKHMALRANTAIDLPKLKKNHQY